MTKKNALPTQTVHQRIARLRERQRAILDLGPEEKLKAILNVDQPAALVHAFSEQDVLMMVEEIGPDSALEVIALASDRQWEHLVDASIWQGDRLDLVQTTRWFHRLCQADFRRTLRWLTREKSEFLELYLFRNINIIVREPDLEPAAMPEGYFSFDESFYMEIPDLPPRIVGEPTDDALRQDLIRDLLSRMAADDHLMLQRILLETIRVLPAEAEEQEYRLRTVRMAEKGFLPFEEAVGLYQPLTPQRLEGKPAKLPVRGPKDSGALPVPLYPSGQLPPDNTFTRALVAVKNPETLAGLQTEFAALCNRLIIADQQRIKAVEDLTLGVKKACGYLHLGLEALGADPAAMATRIQRHSLEDIFRVGYGRCLAIKGEAEKWLKTSWFAGAGLSLTFWDETWTGVLGGLFIKRPLFFDNGETGDTLYREFAHGADLEKTRTVLDRIRAMDAFLSGFPAALEKTAVGNAPLTWKNLLLTCWIRHVLGLEEAPATLAPGQLGQAFETLWPGKKRTDFKDETVKARFLAYLGHAAGMAQEAVSLQVGPVLEDLFSELCEEYDQIRKTDLDPRFIRHFLISGPKD